MSILLCPDINTHRFIFTVSEEKAENLNHDRNTFILKGNETKKYIGWVRAAACLCDSLLK